MKVGFVVKEMFFDAPVIVRRMDAKTSKVLSATGAFSRQAMRRGMRRRKGISQPGDYPSVHGNALLKERILFGFDVQAESLIVGPAKLDTTDKEVAAAGLTIPELLNKGGTVRRRQIYDPKKKQIRFTRRTFTWRYKPRPFVTLTLPTAAAKLADNMEKVDF